MLNSRKEVLGSLGNKSKALTPEFSTKAKGTVINSTPKIDPALAALAFNKRKHFKLG